MKATKFIYLIIFILPIIGFSQTIENLDFISPFHEGLSAIQKDGKWAFINTKGIITIDFREDLVLTKSDDKNYPKFSDGRCLIKQKKEAISYFGYIDTSGKTIIKPEFLNATNFSNGKAIALELTKDTVAKNKALGRDVVYYRYFEVTINTAGVVEHYINPKGTNVVLDKDFLRKPPKITSKQIGENLYAMRHKNKTWSIIRIND